MRCQFSSCPKGLFYDGAGDEAANSREFSMVVAAYSVIVIFAPIATVTLLPLWLIILFMLLLLLMMKMLMLITLNFVMIVVDDVGNVVSTYY